MSFTSKDYNRFPIEVPADLKPMIPDFMKRRKADFAELEVAIKKEDFSLVAKIGHRMKGVGASYGFPAFTEIGKDIEVAGKARKINDIKLIQGKFGSYLSQCKF